LRKFPAIVSNEPEEGQAFFFPCCVVAEDEGARGPVNFYLDTGSSDVIMGENDAKRIGVSLVNLPHTPKPVSGWGGSTTAFLLKKVCIFLKDVDGRMEQFEVPEVIVGRNPKSERVKSKGMQRFVEKRTIPIPSVIGRSFLRDHSLIAYVDVKNGEIYIQGP
jgi:hypothetical protein